MIRFASTADVDAIAEIHVRTWRVAYDHVVPQSVLNALSVEKRADQWRRGISADPRMVIVSESEGRIDGWVAAGPCRDSDRRDGGEVYAIYVRPERWFSGVGRALLAASEEELVDRGFATISLWVLEQNLTACRFYARNGYSPDGARKDVVMGDATLKEVRYRKENKAAQPGATDNRDDAEQN